MDDSNYVLITGGSRGLGLGFVRHYLQLGHRVIATATDPEKAVELRSLQQQHAEKLLILALDVSSESSITAFVNILSEKQIRLLVAINNAGICKAEEFGQWTVSAFELHFQVNTIGPMLLSQAIEPLLFPGSKVVQMSSGMGSAALNIDPQGALDAYAASKSALNILTARLAEKYRPLGIISFALNPGWVKTDMGGPEAPSTVEEVIPRLVTLIDKVDLSSTGRFLSDSGEFIPW